MPELHQPTEEEKQAQAAAQRQSVKQAGDVLASLLKRIIDEDVYDATFMLSRGTIELPDKPGLVRRVPSGEIVLTMTVRSKSMTQAAAAAIREWVIANPSLHLIIPTPGDRLPEQSN